MLVGRLAQDIEVKTTETGKEVTRVSLAVNRSFKNPDGIYEVDFIDCVLWDGLAKNIDEYCKKVIRLVFVEDFKFHIMKLKALKRKR